MFAEEAKAASKKPKRTKRVTQKAGVAKSQLKPDLDLKLPQMSLYQSVAISPKIKGNSPALGAPSKLPSHLRFSSNPIATNVEAVRTSLRKNKFDHLNFNPVLETQEGQRYYKGIYQINEPVYKSVSLERVDEDDENPKSTLKIRKSKNLTLGEFQRF